MTTSDIAPSIVLRVTAYIVVALLLMANIPVGFWPLIPIGLLLPSVVRGWRAERVFAREGREWVRGL